MTLSDYAGFIKSANAGPTMLTIDIGFRSPADFERMVAARVITPELVAGLYPIQPDQVQIYNYAPSSVIKITIPRAVGAGSLDERDYDGVQQFVPLLSVPLPAVFGEAG